MPMGSETFQLNSKRSFDNSLTDIYSSFNPLTTTWNGCSFWTL